MNSSFPLFITNLSKVLRCYFLKKKCFDIYIHFSFQVYRKYRRNIWIFLSLISSLICRKYWDGIFWKKKYFDIYIHFSFRVYHQVSKYLNPSFIRLIYRKYWDAIFWKKKKCFDIYIHFSFLLTQIAKYLNSSFVPFIRH